MLHQVALYEFNTKTGSHDPVQIRYVGSMRAGELLAESLLKTRPVVTTRYCYHRDVRRGAWCMLTEGPGFETHGHKTRTIDAPVIEVPSVGDLGWTP